MLFAKAVHQCAYLWWFEWIFRRKVNVEKEHSTLIDRPRRPKNSRYPLEQIVTFWPSTRQKNNAIISTMIIYIAPVMFIRVSYTRRINGQ